jgi:TP53 regulating kinase and related kinases
MASTVEAIVLRHFHWIANFPALSKSSSLGVQIPLSCKIATLLEVMASSTVPVVPGADWTLLSQGAEARVWKVPEYSANGTAPRVAICKERFPKSYRHPVLDERLTKQRCRMEARLLDKCRAKEAVNVPSVFHVDYSGSSAGGAAILYLEYIDGKTVRDFLEEDILPHCSSSDVAPDPESAAEATANVASERAREILHKLAHDIGLTVAKLHQVGIVHSDLTTSNMMVRHTRYHNSTDATLSYSANDEANMITLIDFGLAKNATGAEERAVDLYVLERALESTHPTLPDSFLQTMFAAYSMDAKVAERKCESEKSADLIDDKELGSFQASKQEALVRLEKVRQRGRKRECFG